MTISLNFNGSGYFAAPTGFPFKLSPLVDTFASGLLPKNWSTISAVVKADTTANVHLGLFKAPTTSPTAGGAGLTSSDGALIAQSDIIGLTSVQQTISVSVPTGVTSTVSTSTSVTIPTSPTTTVTIPITGATLSTSTVVTSTTWYVVRIWVDNLPKSGSFDSNNVWRVSQNGVTIVSMQAT